MIKLLCRDSGERAPSPWLMSQSNFEHVVIISPSAASNTAHAKSTRTKDEEAPRTSLSGVSARYLRANLLVIHEPLLQAAHDAPAVVEGGGSPFFLCFVRVHDLSLNLLLGISKNGVQVVGRGRVICRNVFAVRKGEVGKETVNVQMRLQRRLRELLRGPGIFDLLRDAS